MLENFPIISEDRLDPYLDAISDLSNKQARELCQSSSQNFSQKKKNCFKGWRCKTIAVLARGLDPFEALGYELKTGQDKYKNFFEINGKTFDAFHAVFPVNEQPDNGNMVISLHQSKMDTLIKKFEGGKKFGKGYDPTFMEFIYHNERESMFYHLGLLETGGVGCPLFPGNFQKDDAGSRYLIELEISDEKKDGLFVLKPTG